jgi:hypothetical protein
MLLEGDLGIVAILREILNWLPFIPLWSSCSVLYLVSEQVKDLYLNWFMIHEDDMKRGCSKAPFFDGSNYPF